MNPTTTGTYRVLASTRAADEWLFLDAESGDPTYVPDDALPDGDLAEGNRVRATVAWEGEEPRVEDLTVETRTRFRFGRTDAGLFEAAVDCWHDRGGDPMNSRVTYSNDRDPVGVVYTFAAQPGERDLFAEFRDGVKPLEPLVRKAAEGRDPPFEVFVLDPLPREFVVVYIVFDPDGVLARTVRDTYL